MNNVYLNFSSCTIKNLEQQTNEIGSRQIHFEVVTSDSKATYNAFIDKSGSFQYYQEFALVRLFSREITADWEKLVQPIKIELSDAEPVTLKGYVEAADVQEAVTMLQG